MNVKSNPLGGSRRRCLFGSTPGNAQHEVISPIMGNTTVTTTVLVVVVVYVVERFMAEIL